MISVALVTGGDNGEKEVSLRSAETFLQYMDKNKYSVTVFHFPHDRETFFHQLADFNLVIPVIHGVGGEDGEITRLCEEASIPYFFTDSKTHELCIDKYTCGELVRQSGYSLPQSWQIQKGYTSLPTYNGKVFIKPVHGGSSVDSDALNFNPNAPLCRIL